MRKINIEKKCDLALNEAVNSLRFNDTDVDSFVVKQFYRYTIEKIISILCITDDWVIEGNPSYYCFSELERNLSDYIETIKTDQKRKGE